MSVLMVYAMIYSFSTRGKGICFAESEILAKRLGISKRTVDRAIDILLSKGFIKRDIMGELYGYTVTDIPQISSDTEKSVKREEKDKKTSVSEKKNIKTPEKPIKKFASEGFRKVPEVDEFKDYYGEELAEDIPVHPKKMNKLWRENNPYDMSEILEQQRENDPVIKAEHLEEGEDYYEDMQYDPDNLPKYIFRSYGRKGYIQMTREQYADLYSLVDPGHLQCYISRLEQICEECLNNFTRVPKGHYRLIRKWIDEDTSVNKKKR